MLCSSFQPQYGIGPGHQSWQKRAISSPQVDAQKYPPHHWYWFHLGRQGSKKCYPKSKSSCSSVLGVATHMERYMDAQSDLSHCPLCQMIKGFRCSGLQCFPISRFTAGSSESALQLFSCLISPGWSAFLGRGHVQQLSGGSSHSHKGQSHLLTTDPKAISRNCPKLVLNPCMPWWAVEAGLSEPMAEPWSPTAWRDKAAKRSIETFPTEQGHPPDHHRMTTHWL